MSKFEYLYIILNKEIEGTRQIINATVYLKHRIVQKYLRSIQSETCPVLMNKEIISHNS